MNDKKCLSEATLLSFVDNDLPPEQLKRVEEHLELCSACTRQVMALEELIGDVAAPVARGDFDVSAHVAAVMQRLDERRQPPRKPSWARWGVPLAAAAALGVLVVGLHQVSPGARFEARGSAAEASLTRDVGVQLYASESTLRPLGSGASVRREVALTAGLRNLARSDAHLLLFGVDARGNVHWIAPEYTVPGSNPEAATIEPSATERLLSSSVVFEDLAPGTLKIVAVIGREPMRVLDIEALAPAELASERLMKRFPRAEIRQFQLEVTP